MVSWVINRSIQNQTFEGMILTCIPIFIFTELDRLVGCKRFFRQRKVMYFYLLDLVD